MSRRKEIALVTAGILAGIAVSGPATQAAAGLMANPSSQKFYLEDRQINLQAYASRFPKVSAGLLARNPSQRPEGIYGVAAWRCQRRIFTGARRNFRRGTTRKADLLV